jgi:hypothetical protein
MRLWSSFCVSLAAVVLASCLAATANAHVLIDVDKSSQQMTVSVNGQPRYHFIVSTGRPGFGTPTGTFHPQRMETTWFSKEYYNSPMPHAIFFHGGFAIHGSYEINALGGPASHGCIRLHPDNAATLYALVEREGMSATTIVVSGDNPSARAPVAGQYEQPDYSYPPRAPGYGQQRPSPYYQQPYPQPYQQPYQQPGSFWQSPQRGY